MTIVHKLADEQVSSVAAFLNTCWRVAYAGLLDADFLAGLTTEDRAARLHHKIDLGAQGMVAQAVDGQIIGVTVFGPPHLKQLVGAGQIDMLYVHPDRIGTGLGHHLLNLAEANLRELDYRIVGLDVFSANHQGVSFYKDHGYNRTGGKVDVIEGVEYPLDIMSKRIV